MILTKRICICIWKERGILLYKLRDKLEELDDHVFYGIAGSREDVDDIWNYIVFGRSKMSSSESKKSFTDRYEVIIVRENFIPIGFIDEVINKVEECGLKLANEDAEYKYTRKNNTDLVVEILTIPFIKARKRCC